MSEEEKINRLLNSIAKSSEGIIADEVKEIIIKQQKEIEELKGRNYKKYNDVIKEKDIKYRFYYADYVDKNYIEKDKIRELINKRNAGIGYTSLECIEDIEKLLEE